MLFLVLCFPRPPFSLHTHVSRHAHLQALAEQQAKELADEQAAELQQHLDAPNASQPSSSSPPVTSSPPPASQCSPLMRLTQPANLWRLGGDTLSPLPTPSRAAPPSGVGDLPQERPWDWQQGSQEHAEKTQGRPQPGFGLQEAASGAQETCEMPWATWGGADDGGGVHRGERRDSLPRHPLAWMSQRWVEQQQDGGTSDGNGVPVGGRAAFAGGVGEAVGEEEDDDDEDDLLLELANEIASQSQPSNR